MVLSQTIARSGSDSLLSEYASVLGDAIHRYRAHIAEQSARLEAELSDRLKSEFLANMSHELRTPLNTIIGFSRLLTEVERNGFDSQQISEYATLINGAAEHLLHVINDILEISKIQGGRFRLNMREVHVEEILHATLSDISEEARQADVDLRTRIRTDLPTVIADSRRLARVFSGLLSNALKFTPEGGSISVRAERAEPDAVRISIRDTGVGMTEEEMKVALTPFGQVDGSRSRHRQGTGLGLPIAKALVELQNGQLHIASAKNVGTEVTVLLPACQRTPARAPAVGLARPPSRNNLDGPAT